MKKPTIFKALLVVLFLLQSSISVAQNLVAYNSSTSSYLNNDPTLLGQLATNHYLKSALKNDKNTKKIVAPVDANPVIKYAELPYAGQVAVCPNNNKLLPKLFLCGGNDSRLIETGIKDAKSIIWERFSSGGSCITVSNSDCANENAAVTCWKEVATGENYLANSAGQFRIRIIDNTETPFVYYFNVYQNTLIPTAVTKSNIISSGTCTIPGKITVGGFGAGYEYYFTSDGISSSNPNDWKKENVFTTTTPGIYTAFIRIKGVVGSCEFKVLNLEIKSVDFKVTTSFISPKCYGSKGSIQVITNDIKLQYTYKIFKGNSTTPLNTITATFDPSITFIELDPAIYKVVTSVDGSTCVVDTKYVTIADAPTQLTANMDRWFVIFFAHISLLAHFLMSSI